ncbi:MAG: hypothetical protein R2755_02800 [Acidimicrobiales bacterium]
MLRFRCAAPVLVAIAASGGRAVAGTGAQEGTAPAAGGEGPTPTSPTSGDVVSAGPRTAAAPGDTGEPDAASASVSTPSPAVAAVDELSVAATVSLLGGGPHERALVLAR